MTKHPHAVLALSTLLLPTLLSAQVTPPTGELATLPVSPLPVGTRCLSLATACSAIADDIDMLMANPAGPAGLENTRLNLELRFARLKTVYLDQDAVNSEYLGTRPGRLYKELEDNTADISFAGISMPFGRWTLSGFYSNSMQFSGDLDVEKVTDSQQGARYINSNSFSTSLQSIGLSAAIEISDAWSAGISVMSAEFELETVDTWEASSLTGDSVLQSDYDSLLVGNNMDDSARDTLIHAGLIFRPGEKYSFGLSYRQGGDYRFDTEAVLKYGTQGAINDVSQPATTSISLADSIALGFGWRPAETWLISLEFERFSHSDLPPVRDRTLGLDLSVAELTHAIDDTNSFKVGVEKQFLGSKSGNRYSVRAGVRTQDDYDGLNIVEGYDTLFSAGFGAVFGRRQQFSMDAAVLGGDEEIMINAAITYALP